jgi:DNA topoisomerase III
MYNAAANNNQQNDHRRNNNRRRIIKVLNVAEKPSVAKEVSRQLSNNSYQTSKGKSKYNNLFKFPFQVNGTMCDMTFTSVTGHLMNYEFDQERYRSWNRSNARDLFQIATVSKAVSKDKNDVKVNLEEEAKKSEWLILWLDCDREGENIAMEVVDVCSKANRRLKVFRARFSALSRQDVCRALERLQPPDELASIAVDARQELDLRLGSAFTRFNTLCLQRNGVIENRGGGGGNNNNNNARNNGRNEQQQEKGEVISYGPCQFPTLGFIVQRKWDVDAHVPEKFWTISISFRMNNDNNNSNNNGGEGRVVEFKWNRQRVFDEAFALALFERVQNAPHATVLSTRGQEQKRYPPHPLNTLEMQKRLNRTLRISPEKIMAIAEGLYQKGFISYPRTETDKFPDSFNFEESIAMFYEHGTFGVYARELLENGGLRKPPGGNRDDKAHPPIYPAKLATVHELQNMNVNDRQVYEFILRHFLATCSKPAIGFRTTVEVDCAGEGFKAYGLMITDRAYLRIYGPGPILPNGPGLQPYYDNWFTQAELPVFEDGALFQPSNRNLRESETRSPEMLSEVDLLTLMEKNGIGTDATQAQHIEKVVGERGYAKKVGDNRLVPTNIGEALVAGYDSLQLGFMWQPTNRAETEKDVDNIHKGFAQKEAVVHKHILPMIRAFDKCIENEREYIRVIKKFVERGRNVDVEQRYGRGNARAQNGEEDDRDFFEDEDDIDQAFFNNNNNNNNN